MTLRVGQLVRCKSGRGRQFHGTGVDLVAGEIYLVHALSRRYPGKHCSVSQLDGTKVGSFGWSNTGGSFSQSHFEPLSGTEES